MISFTNADLAHFTGTAMQEYSSMLAQKVHKKKSQRRAYKGNIAQLNINHRKTTSSVYLRSSQAG